MAEHFYPPKIKASKEPKWFNPLGMVVLTVVVYFAAQIIASLFFIFLALGAGWDDGRLNEWFTETSLPQFIFVGITDVLIVLSVRYLLKVRNLSFKDLGWKKPHISDAGKALLAYIVYAVLFILVSVLAKKLVPSLNLEQEQQLGFEANKGAINLILAGISLVVLPPIVEEILCRGFLYTGLRDRLKVWPAALITSVVFAVAHLQFGSDAPLLWVAAIDTFILSMVLVYLREKTGSLAAPIMLHALKNAIAFSLLFIFV